MVNVRSSNKSQKFIKEADSNVSSVSDNDVGLKKDNPPIFDIS